jgi:hypothetical protein
MNFSKQFGLKNVDLKKLFFCDVQMICSSNVVFINNPDLNLKFRLKPDPNQVKKKKNNNNFRSTTLAAGERSADEEGVLLMEGVLLAMVGKFRPKPSLS